MEVDVQGAPQREGGHVRVEDDRVPMALDPLDTAAPVVGSLASVPPVPPTARLVSPESVSLASTTDAAPRRREPTADELTARAGVMLDALVRGAEPDPATMSPPATVLTLSLLTTVIDFVDNRFADTAIKSKLAAQGIKLSNLLRGIFIADVLGGVGMLGLDQPARVKDFVSIGLNASKRHALAAQQFKVNCRSWRSKKEASEATALISRALGTMVMDVPVISPGCMPPRSNRQRRSTLRRWRLTRRTRPRPPTARPRRSRRARRARSPLRRSRRARPPRSRSSSRSARSRPPPAGASSM
jgi:hypothetical protein